MSRHSRLLSPAALLALTAALVSRDEPAEPRPPTARKVPHVARIHGDTRTDDYHWLRDKTKSEVIAHLEAENAYTDARTRHLKDFHEKLYKEVLGRIQQTDLSVPARDRGWFYYVRTVEGKQYPVFCRKKGSLDAEEEVLLDANEQGKGHKFFSVAMTEVSDDGNLYAYATDTSGFREYYLTVKDLKTGKVIEDRKRKVAHAVWAADNKTLFYITEDAAKRAYRLYRHVIGTDADELVYEEKDELFRLWVDLSHDRKYLLATSRSSTTTEVRTLPADKPSGAFQVLLPRKEGHEYYVDHRDGEFWLRTNRDGARNFKLMTAATEKPAEWKEVVPHRPAVMLNGVEVFRDFAVLHEREGGVQHLAVRDLKTGQTHRVALPEEVRAVFPADNPEFDSPTFRYNYQSPVTPPTVFEYDVKGQKSKELKRQKVLGDYDPSRYQTERTLAEAKDGTRVPVSLVYRKDVKRDGKAPLWLNGYGSYGSSVRLTFSPQNVGLLDRGVTIAWAHVRGGGDLGRAWHDAGKMLNKKNTFTDFIACADHLIAQKYTSADRLAIQGGSAGGLLIGAVLNQRPDLCRVAVLNVPFVDVVNTMLDPSLPLTVQEYLEWGNPNVKAEYEYMKSYCPYTHLKAADYPAMLVTTSLNDSQVMYWEPAKYVARLRTLKTDRDPLLLKINMAGGHGGSSGRYDVWKERAFITAFVLDQLGIRE